MQVMFCSHEVSQSSRAVTVCIAQEILNICKHFLSLLYVYDLCPLRKSDLFSDWPEDALRELCLVSKMSEVSSP